MKQKQRYLVFTLVAFMLAGCGLKGPLYMPSKEQNMPNKEQTTGQQPQGQQSVAHQTETVKPSAQADKTFN